MLLGGVCRAQPAFQSLHWLLCCAGACAVLCPAGSSEADELVKIAAVLGTPTQDSWPEGLKLAAAMDFR
jgi:uncharacterized protein CbrC (UPF0167 family)